MYTSIMSMNTNEFMYECIFHLFTVKNKIQ